MGSKVSIVKCDDYFHVREAVEEAVSLIGGLSQIISRGDRVLLKPNILAGRDPGDAVTTHPAVVSAVCELVKQAGGIPLIGDGAGITHPGATAEAFRICGIEEVARAHDAELVNFQTAGYVETDVPDSVIFPRLYISRAVLEADVIISIPKLKTHELTYYTGAVKNMFGALPLRARKEMHFLGDRKLFGEAVADLYSVTKPHLAVMDAVVGMEGNGPSHGNPVKTGLIIASRDCVSLDVVASSVIGLDPMSVPTTAAAISRGMGQMQPEIAGVPMQDAEHKYTPPGVSLLYNMPPLITKLFGRLFEQRPRIDPSKCVLCGACAMNCSVHAVEEEEDYLLINRKKCIMCYCCRELCHSNAVDIEMSLLAWLITAVKK